VRIGLLFFNGVDMRDLPLLKRRSRLYDGLEGLRGIAAIKHLEAHGRALFAQALELGLEGLVAKCADSQYRARLHRAWLISGLL
jgi:bifunctional non-homologous end joining protein LigD